MLAASCVALYEDNGNRQILRRLSTYGAGSEVSPDVIVAEK